MQDSKEYTEHTISKEPVQKRYIGVEAYRKATEKTKLAYFFILFLISPILGALSAAFNFRKNGARTILILFVGLFGFTLIMREGADSFDVMTDFVYHFGNLSMSEFAGQFYEILKLETPRHYGGTNNTMDDLYLPMVSFIVSRFTNDYSWFFLITGLVYGFFYLKSISMVYFESRQNLNLALGILFVFFFSFLSLEGVQGPRTNTANWVLFSGVFLYLKTQDAKYIFIIMLAPVVHFGYVAMIAMFFVYYFFRDLKYLYIAILIISYFASASLSFIEPYLIGTGLGESKLDAYTGGPRWDPELRGEVVDDRSFHARYYESVAYYSMYFMFFFSLIWTGYLTNKYHDRLLNGLAGIAILLLSFANFASIIPVLSSRLTKSFALFALAYLVLLYSKNWQELKQNRWIVYICIPFILLYLFTKYSIIGNYMDFKVMVSPLLYPFIGDDPVSMKEFIRQFFL